MSEVYEKLERWSILAAQELQDMLDDAADCGSQLAGVKELIEELDDIINELHGSWQELLNDSCDCSESDRIDLGETH